MTEYKVRGESESGVESALPLEKGRLEVRQAVRIDPAVRADGPTATIDIDDDDLIEVELDSGFVLWTTVDRLQEDTQRGATRDGDDPLLLPVNYPLERPGAERGFVSDLITGLKVVRYDLPKGGALAVAKKIEGQLEGDGELFRISEKGDLFPGTPAMDSHEPTLVLIHGTASATANAYSGLFKENSATWGEILDYYDGRAYGFDHRTLSQSPLENAIDFLEAIPEGAKLHLVSHSRGGLVGDLIAHGGITGDVFAKEDLDRELAAAVRRKAFTKKAASEYRDLYLKFNRLIREKGPCVERFVRVGCPAAGTTLASGRLDVYLSILIYLIQQVPGVGPFLAGLGEFAAAVAKERTKPDVLPGLEAQMPKSAFVRLLNASPHELQSDLTVLAGDSEGIIKNLANLFYWTANDLVVDTRSMYGGALRHQRLWHLEENRDVTHVNYFKRFETAQVVRRGLLRQASDTTGFESHLPKGVDRGHVDVGEPIEKIAQPGVILIPGVMGSHLRVTDKAQKIDNRIWLDKSDLMKGRGALLQMDKYDVRPDGVLKRGYDDFRDYLARRGLHIMPYAFDWRESLKVAADELASLIEKRLNASSEPLYLIAHSMGGVVASLFMARHDDTWQRLKKSGGRLVQAGTPNLGSYVIPRILDGSEKMVRFLAALDLVNGKKKWAEWSSAFPGLLEMAPNFDSLDFSLRKTWDDLGVLSVPEADALGDAQEIRKVLATQTQKLADEGVSYVAGGPHETPVYDSVASEIRFTMRGDGRVTWESGIPTGAPTWYIPAKHGSLLDHKRAFAGLRELIVTGSTHQLSSERPAASSVLSRGETVAPQLARDQEQIEFIPTIDDLEEAALGMDESYGREEAGPPVPPCEVSVVHGDLRFVEKKPVIVGHYRGDPIVSAESVLDWCLGGALRSRHQLELYPGEIGTAEAVIKRYRQLDSDERGPTGAIVLGLGDVGELTKAGLIRSVETGLLRYVQTCRDRAMETSSLKVSALLVGSGEAGLAMRQIVEAFLVGVSNVNRALEKVRSSEDEGGANAAIAYISHIEFIEIYRDIALDALHSLLSLPSDPSFRINSNLETRDAGRQRPRIISPSNWWTRLAIYSRDDGPSGRATAAQGDDSPTLRFVAYGERARADVNRVPLQGPLVEGFLEEAIRNTTATESLPSQTLFEMLLPPDLKGSWEGRNLQLVLDPGSAAYPWELLIDRMAIEQGPVAVSSGLLRQLRVDEPNAVSYPEKNRILVVGDPPSRMPRLPGAREEAVHVAELFDAQGWRVERQIRNKAGRPGISASTIVGKLLNTDPRILHLAGHGIYDPSSAWKSGMVLGGMNPDAPLQLLTSVEVEKMRLQPELVFINCCHLGRIQRTHTPPPLYRLASNLAEQFIEKGVKAVVAAGWPVDDAAATTFCEVFYDWMLRGEDFGEAVKRARQRTYKAHPRTNTWGAYQCYGDPGFRLLMDVKVRARVSGRHYSPRDFVDPSELIIGLDNLVSRAKVAKSDYDKDKTVKRREELRALALRKGWLDAEGVLAGVARIHGELSDFRTAIEIFEEASKLEKSGITVTDLEQIANYWVRLGRGEDKAAAKKAIETGIERFDGLIAQVGATAERLSLLGSAYKREAELGRTPGEVRESLREMTSNYTDAADFKAADWYYPATNALLGVVLLGGPLRAKETRRTVAQDLRSIPWASRKDFKATLNATDAYLQGLGVDDFWVAVSPIDLDVVRALADGKLPAKVGELVKRYQQLISFYGSERQIDSVTEQWRIAQEIAKRLRRVQLRDALAVLNDAVKASQATPE